MQQRQRATSNVSGDSDKTRYAIGGIGYLKRSKADALGAETKKILSTKSLRTMQDKIMQARKEESESDRAEHGPESMHGQGSFCA